MNKEIEGERVIKILRNAVIVFSVVTLFNYKKHGKFCAFLMFNH